MPSKTYEITSYCDQCHQILKFDDFVELNDLSPDDKLNSSYVLNEYYEGWDNHNDNNCDSQNRENIKITKVELIEWDKRDNDEKNEYSSKFIEYHNYANEEIKQ